MRIFLTAHVEKYSVFLSYPLHVYTGTCTMCIIYMVVNVKRFKKELLIASRDIMIHFKIKDLHRELLTDSEVCLYDQT